MAKSVIKQQVNSKDTDTSQNKMNAFCCSAIRCSHLPVWFAVINTSLCLPFMNSQTVTLMHSVSLFCMQRNFFPCLKGHQSPFPQTCVIRPLSNFCSPLHIHKMCGVFPPFRSSDPFMIIYTFHKCVSSEGKGNQVMYLLLLFRKSLQPLPEALGVFT